MHLQNQNLISSVPPAIGAVLIERRWGLSKSGLLCARIHGFMGFICVWKLLQLCMRAFQCVCVCVRARLLSFKCICSLSYASLGIAPGFPAPPGHQWVLVPVTGYCPSWSVYFSIVHVFVCVSWGGAAHDEPLVPAANTIVLSMSYPLSHRGTMHAHTHAHTLTHSQTHTSGSHLYLLLHTEWIPPSWKTLLIKKDTRN